ncbi:hypothetical protein LshimejAT787_1602620 [Lyophyllum shimeji]|uniref:Uncharacterized protein n=1 Tax=Lyophyllum shimeji TaxID=47721 RepID=A0A9P3PWL7_LYOSH|nr:hypothetical protein LshimejAT787_1602620 [Lyophyllum shimeji]
MTRNLKWRTGADAGSVYILPRTKPSPGDLRAAWIDGVAAHREDRTPVLIDEQSAALQSPNAKRGRQFRIY